ncbi:succinyl-diaminopimelate desuccinylase [Corynebacterium tapiri]|uniref:Succinyl-diaminopimelate desuccinylase n=1 Tax=Corynebacterium tapiri TaxID=1448266 RepID=A0A5C4U6N0_9CORY|nr:succinyl-diaminopimelate desuccinylase [Corynebacterium tapiri]TNM00565.1 succinyl-diaminopimelate desuccinylase [Corynebacterium tapiri]
MSSLALSSDPVALTAALVDVPSPSHHESRIADAIEQALRELEGVEVKRVSNTVVARTQRDLGSRVILAGHVDTVPIADNVPHHMEGDMLYGCGSVDMKSGLAVYLHTFARLANSPDLKRDLTLICYEGEEVSSEYNGLGILEREAPEWLVGDLALLGEPSGGVIEAGCQGTIRVKVTGHGVRAHSARAWLGDNAAHRLAEVLTRVASYEPRTVTVEGCEYREGLNVVGLKAGVATNTLPDEAEMLVNFRFAPDRTLDEALEHLYGVLAVDGEHVTVEVDDAVGGARPGLDKPAAQALLDAVGGNFRAKFGWTDVSRFSTLAIPAVNYGPGDPGLAHKPEEHCPVDQITQVADVLYRFCTSPVK